MVFRVTFCGAFLFSSVVIRRSSTELFATELYRFDSATSTRLRDPVEPEERRLLWSGSVKVENRILVDSTIYHIHEGRGCGRAPQVHKNKGPSKKTIDGQNFGASQKPYAWTAA